MNDKASVVAGKLTPALASRTAGASPHELLDIIIELRPGPAAAPDTGRASIQARRQAFERNATPVDETIRKVGGEVVGNVWLNHTMKARVPARALVDLSHLDVVQLLDVPHRLRPDTSDGSSS